MPSHSLPPSTSSRAAADAADAIPRHIIKKAGSMAMAGEAQVVSGLLAEFPALATCKMLSNGETLLHLAGNADTVRAVVAAGGDVNARTVYGSTPLAVSHGKHSAEVIRALVAAGADVEARSLNGWTPLRGMVVHASDIDHDMADDRGVTDRGPGGYLNEAIQALLECGANPDPDRAFDGRGSCLLFEAMHPVSVRLLAEHGADVHQANRRGRTALRAAVEDPNACTHTVQAFLNAGCDPRKADDEGLTPLHAAFRREHILALVAGGGDIHAKTPGERRQPLHCLVDTEADWGYYRRDAVLAMLRAGADINAADRAGLTPLFLAHSAQTAVLLLEQGADPGLRDARGRTAAANQRQMGRETVAVAIESWQAGLALRGEAEKPRKRKRG